MSRCEMTLFCDNCLEAIREDEPYFEAVSRKRQRVVLCRSCLYDNDFVPDRIKEAFAQYDEEQGR